MPSSRLLFSNGSILCSPDAPSVSTFLESHPVESAKIVVDLGAFGFIFLPGAYTTTRTHKHGSCLLFWGRHLQRLANSARILSSSNPQLFSKLSQPKHSLTSLLMASSMWQSTIESFVNDSMNKVLPIALGERKDGEELAITVLVSGDMEKLSEIEIVGRESVSRVLDVHVHFGGYVPLQFGVPGNGANLAMVGRGREVAEAKYSEWVRLRKSLERLRPPSVTELLLSNDGDRVLEGCVTNFFVVYCKENSEVEGKNTCPFEVQTAPISDGVLPGIIRELVIEVCLSNGIPLQEVAPTWSKREFWQEAFITNSLRIVQHVEKIQVPSSWESLEQKTHAEISWEEKQFGEKPGVLTSIIQEEIMGKALLDGHPAA